MAESRIPDEVWDGLIEQCFWWTIDFPDSDKSTVLTEAIRLREFENTVRSSSLWAIALPKEIAGKPQWKMKPEVGRFIEETETYFILKKDVQNTYFFKDKWGYETFNVYPT